jgi:UDP-2,3-diacylglucosamine pyrophosphatase LpxH
MSERRQTLIVSDLHLGGGAADPGDDHVYQNRQLERFVRQSLASPAGQEGQIELFFNGDFLEFAQVRQEAYRSPSTDYWCSEPESLEKLEAILAGHDNSFAALQAFQEAGNRVTLAAGNHDVDLCWPAVRKRLRARIGPGLRFETGVDWVERHDGRLHIGHGHLEDPANRFKHWSAPILQAPDGARLEMCPGTLFMVRFVNGLEARYPFADNLHPVQNLATVLLREDTGGFASAGWMLLKFIARHAKTLGASEASDVGRRLLARLREDDDFAQRLAAACRLLGAERSPESVRRDVSDEDSLAECDDANCSPSCPRTTGRRCSRCGRRRCSARRVRRRWARSSGHATSAGRRCAIWRSADSTPVPRRRWSSWATPICRTTSLSTTDAT